MVLKTVQKRRKQSEAKTKERLWTYDELATELAETNQPTELWDGELIMTPAPAPKHQTVVFRLGRDLDDFVSERELGQVFLSPIDVVLSQRRVVQPDIIYISKANQHIIQNQIRGVPDLIVEVVSPGSWRRDHIEKKALYEQYGVREYWIVDPEAETIEVWALRARSYELVGRFGRSEKARSELLAGFEVDAAELIG